MRSMIYPIIFFICLCFAASQPDAARLYLWQVKLAESEAGEPCAGESGFY